MRIGLKALTSRPPPARDLDRRPRRRDRRNHGHEHAHALRPARGLARRAIAVSLTRSRASLAGDRAGERTRRVGSAIVHLGIAASARTTPAVRGATDRPKPAAQREAGSVPRSGRSTTGLLRRWLLVLPPPPQRGQARTALWLSGVRGRRRSAPSSLEQRHRAHWRRPAVSIDLQGLGIPTDRTPRRWNGASRTGPRFHRGIDVTQPPHRASPLQWRRRAPGRSVPGGSITVPSSAPRPGSAARVAAGGPAVRRGGPGAVAKRPCRTPLGRSPVEPSVEPSCSATPEATPDASPSPAPVGLRRCYRRVPDGPPSASPGTSASVAPSCRPPRRRQSAADGSFARGHGAQQRYRARCATSLVMGSWTIW